MSEGNLETLRRFIDAYNRGDADAMIETLPPDAVLDWSNSRGVESGVYRGHDEIRAFVRRFRAAWDEVRIEIEDPTEVGDDVVIAENVAHLRGRDGIEVQARSAWLIRFRNGAPASLTLYQTKQEALEAAGLPE